MSNKKQSAIKLIGCILIILLVGFTTAANAQTKVKTDAQGNYVTVKKERKERAATPATPTGKTFTDAKGKVYPVYQSEKGNLFITRTSKSGKEYKQYLKVE